MNVITLARCSCSSWAMSIRWVSICTCAPGAIDSDSARVGGMSDAVAAFSVRIEPTRIGITCLEMLVTVVVRVAMFVSLLG